MEKLRLRLERAAEWAARDAGPGSVEVPEKPPCRYATLLGRTACCGNTWECANPLSGRDKATEKFCRFHCTQKVELAKDE